MKHNIPLALALGLGLLLALPLHARSRVPARPVKHPPTQKELFDKLDTNHDGFLTLEEFSVGTKDPLSSESHFRAKDTNGDGKLSFEEYIGKAKKV